MRTAVAVAVQMAALILSAAAWAALHSDEFEYQMLAPVDGIAVQLKYNTDGGVIEPGKPIAGILPKDAASVVETMVLRADIDSLQVGQKGMIRLVALNQRTPPVLEGSVFYISADAIRDTAAAPASRNADVARIALSADEVARALGSGLVHIS